MKRLERARCNLPGCLSRFRAYPPGPDKLAYPRCLFESPFPANPDFWLNGVDFTCASPWNDSCGVFRAGTAISRRHVIFAKHFPLGVGARLAFVGETGETSHYSVKATKALENCDIMIGLLDYELTPDVHPAKVLPEDFGRWIPPGSKWPVVTFNQREQAYLSEISCRTNKTAGGWALDNRTPGSATWRAVGGRLVVGDSGNPAFLLYRGRTALLYCCHTGGVGHGPCIHENRAKVQQTMDDLCPGYRLEALALAEK